jgi:putative DNA primase/helicase
VNAADIARSLGGAHLCGQWWRCRCPVHKSRSPTLALRDGDRALLVKCFAGCTAEDILAELRRLGITDDRSRDHAASVPTVMAGEDAGRIDMARRTWDAARDARRSPVVRYLAGRGITLPPPAALRWAPLCAHPTGVCLPAMVAAIRDLSGRGVGVHRTYLRPDGSGKADVEPTKAMLGKATGCAVRLAEASGTLLVGEGIETSLSAMPATGMPAWAALSTSGMAGLVLPPAVREVVIVADHDSNSAGERAARAAAERWLAEGRRVRIAMPPVPGTDFNDVLLGVANAPVAGGRDV